MKKNIILVLSLLFTILAWYIAADRWTPYTSNALVKAVVTPIVSEVSGTLTELSVGNGTIVESGQHLATVDKRSYELARDMAQADLQLSLQDVSGKSASIEAAQAKLTKTQIEFENVQIQTQRVLELERRGLAAKADADNARADQSEAATAVEEAKAELEKARQTLGLEGADNAGVQRALAQLAKTELDLQRTEITAPARGGITNLNVAPGAYIGSGSPLLTFVDIGQIWVEAYLTENNLEHVDVGDPVEISLDIRPGRVYQGRVISISGAASDASDTKPGSLSNVPKQSGWLREPKRIPIRIAIKGYETGNPDDNIRFLINGQADVVVYSGDNILLNIVGKFMIRTASVLSYAY